ncbi:MAG: hypothetical protein PSV35_04390, partial [bacterium]|nr:hypothetical protein [bacterium]
LAHFISNIMAIKGDTIVGAWTAIRRYLVKLYSGISLVPPATNFKELMPTVNPFTLLNSQIFDGLKKEEQRQFTDKKRRRFSYSANITASLALPYTIDKLVERKSDFRTLLNMSQNNIIEHANRRVDLFFYTLVAYYNTSAPYSTM